MDINYEAIRQIIDVRGLEILSESVKRKGILTDLFPDDKLKTDLIDKVLTDTDVIYVREICQNLSNRVKDVDYLSKRWKQQFWINDSAINFVWDFFVSVFAPDQLGVLHNIFIGDYQQQNNSVEIDNNSGNISNSTNLSTEEKADKIDSESVSDADNQAEKNQIIDDSDNRKNKSGFRKLIFIATILLLALRAFVFFNGGKYGDIIRTIAGVKSIVSQFFDVKNPFFSGKDYSGMNMTLDNPVFQSVAERQEPFAKKFAMTVAKRHYGLDNAELYFLSMGVSKNSFTSDGDYWNAGFTYILPETAKKRGGIVEFKYIYVALVSKDKLLLKQLNRDTVFNDHHYKTFAVKAYVNSGKCVESKAYCYHANGESMGTTQNSGDQYVVSKDGNTFARNMYSFIYAQ